MPLRSQKLDATGIEMTASNGKTFTMTAAQVRARFLIETGTVAQRGVKTITWLKQEIVNALGADQIDLAGLDFDFDRATGRPLKLTHRLVDL